MCRRRPPPKLLPRMHRCFLPQNRHLASSRASALEAPPAKVPPLTQKTWDGRVVCCAIFTSARPISGILRLPVRTRLRLRSRRKLDCARWCMLESVLRSNENLERLSLFTTTLHSYRLPPTRFGNGGRKCSKDHGPWARGFPRSTGFFSVPYILLWRHTFDCGSGSRESMDRV